MNTAARQPEDAQLYSPIWFDPPPVAAGRVRQSVSTA